MRCRQAAPISRPRQAWVGPIAPVPTDLPTESPLTPTHSSRSYSVRSVDFVSALVAEELPAEALGTDLKLPSIASALAVQDVGLEREWLGSFDVLIRVRASHRTSSWHKYHRCTGAIDYKLMGTSKNFGLSFTRMRRHLSKGRLVLKSARQQKRSSVGSAMYLVPFCIVHDIRSNPSARS